MGCSQTKLSDEFEEGSQGGQSNNNSFGSQQESQQQNGGGAKRPVFKSVATRSTTIESFEVKMRRIKNPNAEAVDEKFDQSSVARSTGAGFHTMHLPVGPKDLLMQASDSGSHSPPPLPLAGELMVGDRGGGGSSSPKQQMLLPDHGGVVATPETSSSSQPLNPFSVGAQHHQQRHQQPYPHYSEQPPHHHHRAAEFASPPPEQQTSSGGWEGLSSRECQMSSPPPPPPHQDMTDIYSPTPPLISQQPSTVTVPSSPQPYLPAGPPLLPNHNQNDAGPPSVTETLRMGPLSTTRNSLTAIEAQPRGEPQAGALAKMGSAMDGPAGGSSSVHDPMFGGDLLVLEESDGSSTESDC